MRKLPPLTAVLAFEAVARLGSVRAAADELNVTQSSISHQIAKIEDHFQVKLFHRRSKRLFLTTGGQDYFKMIEPALDSIANATYSVAKDAKRETLTVSAPPSFIVTWLLPRIDRFLKTHPDLNLRLIDKMILDLEDKSIDCAIEYRFEALKDVQSARLLPDEVVVLAAPDLLRRHTIVSVDSLAGIPLIETERRLVSWNVILQSYPWFKRQKILTFSYSLHALKAAELGLGVALGNRHNAKWYIDENLLCVPFELEEGIVPPTPRYFITSMMQKASIPKVADFTDWIRSEADAK
ncbi:LysR substrate-binding domain-containing protein [Desulforhopalus sp. IMCC35007]|uniref:LysR substrate-binding domain-containing protein n=1 Tax=Desulforhopalus sp. IMCC35007 TaxID=2569543 RepID=UPI0010ADD655|nr:LysR substrate-binding domain-containing protein [Desulforhopalus sp. IMCC35007]TKB06390.1 LysR family transcriptional regulator [Desulforhopalus sp. IMCC35007]